MTETETRDRFEAAAKLVEREHLATCRAGQSSFITHWRSMGGLDDRTYVDAVLGPDEKVARALVERWVVLSMQVGCGVDTEVRISSAAGRYQVHFAVSLPGSGVARTREAVEVAPAAA